MRLKLLFLGMALGAGALLYARARYVMDQPPGSCVGWLGVDQKCESNRALSADTLQKIDGSDADDPIVRAGTAAAEHHASQGH